MRVPKVLQGVQLVESRVEVTGNLRASCGSDIDLTANLQLTTKDELREVMRLTRTVFQRFEALHVPVIAAINGLAIGGGTEILLATDLRVMSPTAQISMAGAGRALTHECHDI